MPSLWLIPGRILTPQTLILVDPGPVMVKDGLKKSPGPDYLAFRGQLMATKFMWPRNYVSNRPPGQNNIGYHVGFDFG